MRRSSGRILTTHVGSLPGLASFDPSKADYREKVAAGVAEVVGRQRETGLDVLNEGDYSKGGDWLSYVDDRFTGFQPGEPKGTPVLLQGKDREAFDKSVGAVLGLVEACKKIAPDLLGR